MFFDSIFSCFDESVKNKSHLDLGCGNGKLCRHFMDKRVSKSTGLDISQEQIDIAKSLYGGSKFSFKTQDVYMPFDLTETYDIVTSIYSLHFAQNYKVLRQASQNIKQHTVDGGIAIVLDITHDYVYQKNKMQELKELTMYEYNPNINEGEVPKAWQTVEGFVHTASEIIQVDHIAIHGDNLIQALKDSGFKTVERRPFIHSNKYFTDLWGENGFNHHLLFCQ
jgi:SAM-dependent methyltransferase